MTTNHEWDGPGGMDFGVGYDAVAGQVRGDCVLRTDPEGEGGEEIYFELDMITSRSELSRKLNVTAAASLKAAIGSGSAKARFLLERSINKYSVYLVASCVVRQAARRMRDVQLNDSARAVLQAGNTEGFRQRCGDEFLVGATSGGEFYGLLEIFTRSEDDYREAQASIRGSGNLGTWSASAAFEEAVRRLSERYELQLRMYSNGGLSDQPLPDSPSGLIEFARTFPQQVRGPGAVKYIATFMDYNSLDLPAGPNLIDVQNQKEKLEWYATQRLQFLDLSSSIDYILNNSDEFQSFDSNYFAQYNNEIRSSIDRLTAAASRCMNDYNSCQFVDLPDAAVRLPQRLDSTVLGARRLAQEASERAQQHGEACHNHLAEILQIRNEIRTGPDGKRLADRARVELANAQQALTLAEHSCDDVELLARGHPDIGIEGMLATAQVARNQAREDVALAQHKYEGDEHELGIYAIGYAPYWNGPNVVHLRRVIYRDNRTLGWLADLKDTQLAESVRDPSGGTALIRPECEAPWVPHGLPSQKWCPVDGWPHIGVFGHAPGNEDDALSGVAFIYDWRDHSRLLHVSFGLSKPSGPDEEVEYLAGSVFHGSILLESSQSGLRTVVDFQLLCFNGTRISDAYIDHNGQVVGDVRRLDDDRKMGRIRADAGKSIGWLSRSFNENQPQRGRKSSSGSVGVKLGAQALQEARKSHFPQALLRQKSVPLRQSSTHDFIARRRREANFPLIFWHLPGLRPEDGNSKLRQALVELAERIPGAWVHPHPSIGWNHDANTSAPDEFKEFLNVVSSVDPEMRAMIPLHVKKFQVYHPNDAATKVEEVVAALRTRSEVGMWLLVDEPYTPWSEEPASVVTPEMGTTYVEAIRRHSRLPIQISHNWWRHAEDWRGIADISGIQEYPNSQAS